MPELPRISNPYTSLSAAANTALVETEAVFRTAKKEFEITHNKARRLENLKYNFSIIIKKIKENFIDFPVTRLDWTIAKIEATYRADDHDNKICTSVGIDPISLHIGLDLRRKYREMHEIIVEQEMRNLVDTVFTKGGDLSDLYKSVLEKTKDKVAAAKPERTFISINLDRDQEIKRVQQAVLDKLPQNLQHAVYLFQHSVGIQTIIAPFREGSARNELLEMNKEQNEPELASAFGQYLVDKTMIEALRPLYDRRKAHLEAVLAGLTPRQAT